MTRLKHNGNAKSDADEPNRDDHDEVDADTTDPAKPLIDQDFAESVNAALHDNDE
jgi:hypothetical protein